MRIEVQIIDEVLQFKQMDGFKDGIYEVEIKNLDTRTSQQNKSQYLWLQMIANKLNAENVQSTQILRPDTKWTMEKVKTMFFDPVIEGLFNVKSSTKLQKHQYDAIIDTMTKAFGQRGIELPPFPSTETKEQR